jgi:hypothetical protein
MNAASNILKDVEPKKVDKSHFPVQQVQVANENDLLYDRFGIANLDDRELTLSIQSNGIQEPLTLSADHVLLSGHRRFAAAKYLGLKTVPVRVVDVVFDSLTKDERLATLRLHNQQREKSPGERIREKMLEIDPDHAHIELVRRRCKNRRMSGAIESNVEMGQTKTRARITTIQFLAAVKKVIQENEEYWPLTDRRVHYLLLNDPPLRHDKKPESKYLNDKGSYKAVTNLLLRARLTGAIPWQAIEDSTRPIQLGGGFATFDQFVAQETESFLTGYSRNLMQGQPHHIEIMLEKNALRTVIESVARNTASRSPLAAVSRLFRRAMTCSRGFGNRESPRLVLLMLTDFDPDGEEIAASFARSLRDDFGLMNIHPVKVALTAEDVRDNDLPSDMDAKESSPNYEKFIARHGTKVVELDAAPVKLLQAKLREAIESVIDVGEFNAQIALEKEDSATIEAHRRVVFDAVGRGA